jgi:hypothetical protein
VLELVDRHDSGSCVRKGVEVQVLSRAFTIRWESIVQPSDGAQEGVRSGREYD